MRGPPGAFSDSSCIGVVLTVFVVLSNCAFYRRPYPVLQWRFQVPRVPVRLVSDAFDSIACLTWCIGIRQKAKEWVLYQMYNLDCL